MYVFFGSGINTALPLTATRPAVMGAGGYEKVSGTAMFAIIPLTILPLIIINVLTFYNIPTLGPDPLAYQVVTVGLMSGESITLVLSDILIAFAVLCLFFEVLRSSSKSIVNHFLSIVVLAVYVAEFVLVPAAGTPLFFQLALISLFSVVAGLGINIRTASRVAYSRARG